MKQLILVLALLGSFLPFRPAAAANASPDGDWSQKNILLQNTAEADWMIRIGDIDNLGFGWPPGFDVFSGNSTPGHGFPWAVDPLDPEGTDRIMVPSSYNGQPPAGSDGYTGSTTRPGNAVQPITLSFNPIASVRNATFQLFVDDFQAPAFLAAYQVTLNGTRFTALEDILNSIVQTGPIGKLVTAEVPTELLPFIASGKLTLLIDDKTTGAGDGFAIDFVKLLINRTGALQTGTISGQVTEAATGRPIPGATVAVFDQTSPTDAQGAYTLTGVPAGLARLTATAPGFVSASLIVDLIAGQTKTGANFQLQATATRLDIFHAVELEFFGRVGAKHVVQFSPDLQTWTDDETITGEGKLVNRLRSARNPQQRYWRVKDL